MKTLEELRVRLEAAAEGSRELDALIEIAFDPNREVIIGQEPGRFPRNPIYGPVSDLLVLDATDLADYINAALVTTSIDAAVALVERCLPGGWWRVEADCGKSAAYATAHIGSFKADAAHADHAPTPALALCLALVRALEAKGPTND